MKEQEVFKIDMYTNDLEDAAFKVLLSHIEMQADMESQPVEVTVHESEEYEHNMTINFFDNEDTMLDSIAVPYYSSLSPEEKAEFNAHATEGYEYV